MIVCDTMIWYLITDEIVEKHSLQGRLICTQTSQIELGSSHKIYKSPEDIKRAIRAIQKFGTIRSHMDAYTYGISQFLPDLRFNPSNSLRRIRSMNDYVNFEPILTTENVTRVRDFLNDHNKDYSGAIQYMNDVSLEIKEKNKGQKQQAKKRDYIKSTRHYLATLLLQAYQGQINLYQPIGIPLDPVRWINLEMIVSVLAAFTRDLDFSGQKIHDNDWPDLMNMMFAGQKDLYWTNETKWIRYINSTVPKYLFSIA